MPHTNTRGNELLRRANVKREKSLREQLFTVRGHCEPHLGGGGGGGGGVTE